MTDPTPEHEHLLLLDEAEKGIADIIAGRTGDARELIATLKARHDAKMAARTAAKTSLPKAEN